MSGVYRWKFTIWDKENNLVEQEIKDWICEFGKKWCFQEEDAGSGKHYQGSISTQKKYRPNEIPKKWNIHWSRAHVNDDIYESKEESRVNGPWRDDDVRIPRQILEVKELYGWQNSVIEMSKKWDSRLINVIVDKKGCIGKSVLVGKMCCELKIARKIPPLDSYKDLMRLAYSMPTSKCYLVDMPRALDKTKQDSFYSAIESIKDGHIWDDRYKYQEKWIDSPCIWLFTNIHPNLRLLSSDRWRIFFVNEEGELKALRCNTNL